MVKSEDMSQDSTTKRAPGRRTILVSTYCALAALLLDWVQFLTIEQTGFALGASAMLVSWVYPYLAALMSWPMHRRAAKYCAVVSIFGGLIVLAKTSHVSVLWMSFNMTGIGVFAYLACAVVFYVGIARYAKANPSGIAAKR